MTVTELKDAIQALTDKYYPFVEDPAKNPYVKSDLGYYQANKETYTRRFTPNVKVQQASGDRGGLYLNIEFHGGVLLRFYLQETDACCAMSFCHSFVLAEDINRDYLKEVILTTAKAAVDLVGGTSNKRWIVNMVETSRRSSDPFEKFEPMDNPTIKYQPLWECFHKHAKRVNTMLMPNANTGNIIHHMEVLF